MINIEKIDTNTFSVTINGVSKTKHAVTVPQEYYETITGGSVSLENLIRASFKFLLDREDNANILRTFDLPVIEQYFPDYKESIKKYL